MLKFEKIKTIFFDYDGTLHNSIKIYGPAFRKAYDFLIENGYAEERQWTDREISYWLGFNPSDMWREFMPSLSDNIRDKASKIIAGEMKSLIESGKPELYEGAIETLEYLKDKHIKLVFISNCKIYYRDCHEKLFNLDNYFEELACSEEYDYIPKYEILNIIKKSYPKEMVIVGDRKQDIEAGRKNRIFTIGCSYGFGLPGELDDADIIINDISDLRKLI
ncbi:HAD family hydrolase [Clostridium manihotivorum]|uniref:HAD family hydrolase n=1 Tax=Clostridium manihotivorum TaxID=2320868 RepID=A0A3R5X4W2_9CLOT|nr:HAD-IA family hydrolase [Clostridium manihotivorum]QAA34788.1 HAD family hydrolase [Clostridium manihotivorum]